MSSTGLLATETTIDKDTGYTNLFVNESTPSQDNSERSNGNIMINTTSENMIQKNMKLIAIILLVLSCIVLSLTYCQPTFIHIREFFQGLMNTLQP